MSGLVQMLLPLPAAATGSAVCGRTRYSSYWLLPMLLRTA
jgi:hypothetical protein